MNNQSSIARWLHLSDIHVSGIKSYDENRLATSLCASLPKLMGRFGQPDFIVFSGDVARTGSEKEYEEATSFFDNLLSISGISKDSLVIVPGNHDVDRTKNAGLLRTIESRKQIDELFCGDPVPQIANRQANFKKWYDSFFEGSRTFLTNTTVQQPVALDLNGVKVSLCGINSAAFSFDDSDQGKLLIGQRCLEEALRGQSREVGDIAIAVLHHPLFWISEVERMSIKSILQDNFDLILHGHLHQTDVEAVAGSSGGVAVVAAGAVYQGSEWPNTANICEVTGGLLKVCPVRYIPSPRETWALDTSMFPESEDYCGSFSLNQVGHSSAERQIVRNPENAVVAELHNKRTASPPAAWMGQLFVTPGDEALYVEPRLCRKPQAAAFDLDQDSDFLTVSDIIASDESYLVEARPEYGGTALLGRLHQDITKAGGRAISINANGFPNYKKKILENLKINESDAKKNIDILLDSFDIDRDRRLLSELSKIPPVRRVIAVSTNRGLAPSVAPELEELPFKPAQIYLWSLGRAEVRELGAKFFDSRDSQHISQITSKVYDDLLALCIPLTPANVIMYLRILHAEGNFSPINRVDIVDRFLTESLRRPSDSYGGSFNYKNKLDLAAAFATFMFGEKIETFSDRKWFEFCDRYKAETLLGFGSKEVLDELISARIVSRHGDVLFFRYSFFFSFFLGRALSQHSGMLQDFLDEKMYLSVGDVLDVVSAFKPNDPSLIEAVSQDLTECIEEFSKTLADKEFDPLLGAIWPGDDKEDEQLWMPVNRAIAEGPANTDEIDKLKSSYLAEARTDDQNVRIRKFLELEFSLFITHNALSDLLKNSNDVGRDKKLAAYDLMLRAELAAFQVGTIFAPELARSRVYRWGGIVFLDFHKAAPDKDPASREAVSKVVISLAESVAMKSADELGISKLAGVFAAHAAASDGVRFSDVLNFAHIVAAKGEGWEAAAKGILQKAEHSAFYLWTMLRVLVNELSNDVVRHQDRIRLKELVAFIRAKRGLLRKNPKPGEVKKLLDKMEREDWFEKDKAATAQGDEGGEK